MLDDVAAGRGLARLLALGGLSLVVAACSGREGATGHPANAGGTRDEPPAAHQGAGFGQTLGSDRDRVAADTRDLFALADARRLDPTLRQAALDPNPERREAAVLAMARLHTPSAAADLRLALRDHVAAVRRAAALGLGAFEDEAPAGTATALLCALAVEADTETRAAMLFDLGRVARDAAELNGLEVGLRAHDAREREGACRGIGNFALRGRGVPPALFRTVLARAGGDREAFVRARCAYALGRLPPPTDAAVASELVAALPALAADADADVRAQAARLFGRYPEAPVGPLRVLAADADPAVATASFRALARRSTPASDGAYAQALRGLLDRALPPRPPPAGGAGPASASASASVSVDAPREASGDAGSRGAGSEGRGASGAVAGDAPLAQVLRVALDEALPLASGVNVGPLAQVAYERLTGGIVAVDRGWALVACAAAAIVDVSRGWPQRVLRCGDGLVSVQERQALAAAVVGAASGDPAGRAGYLQRLYDRGEPRVRIAVVGAVPRVEDPAATRLLLRALGDRDVGVVTASLEAVLQSPARLREPSGPPRTQRGMGIETDTSPVPDAGIATARALPPEARRALLAAASTLREADALEGLLLLAEVAGTLRDPALSAPLGALRTHPSPTLRAKVARALEELGDGPTEDSFDDAALPPPTRAYAPLAAAELPLPSAELHAEVTVVRSPIPAPSALTADAAADENAGPPVSRLAHPAGIARSFTLRLRPDLAPTTVARFVQLARAGFYDGLAFHRVIPGFVVQGGDPRGDGYGGPDFVQRCEDTRTPYRRGTVGMALAGRDTGGSQFFVTLSAQPHLDGRYTAFADVEEGMDVVDAILPGDRIGAVRIVEGPRR